MVSEMGNNLYWERIGATKHEPQICNITSISKQLKGLARPSLGMYSAILRDILKIHSKKSKEDTTSVVGLLRIFYESKMDSKTFEDAKAIASITGYPTPSNLDSYKQLLDILVTYRNKATAHSVTPPRSEYRKRC